jgi:hypothetical protein
VTTADRVATFDNVVDFTDLTSYTEDGLSITAPTYAYVSFTPGLGFSGGFHYPNAGVAVPTAIRSIDALPMYAVEMNVGTGWTITNATTAYYAWETRSGAAVAGSGWFAADLANEQVFGISDVDRFTTLYLANYYDLATAQAGISTALSALAIDNVSGAGYVGSLRAGRRRAVAAAAPVGTRGSRQVVQLLIVPTSFQRHCGHAAAKPIRHPCWIRWRRYKRTYISMTR